jgi:hypothetical protein
MGTKTVAEILRENPVVGTFRPYCYFSKRADAITAYFKGDADYSKRLTDHVTLFLSIDKDELVGCRIKGVSGIIEDLPNYVHVNHGKVQLSVVFLSLRGTAPDAETRRVLNDLGKAASQQELTFESECAADC